jgi:Nucleotidyltransferase domain
MLRAPFARWCAGVLSSLPRRIMKATVRNSPTGYKLHPNVKPSISLEKNRARVREILQHFRMGNPRIFGSAARGEDNEQSDLDILIRRN